MLLMLFKLLEMKFPYSYVCILYNIAFARVRLTEENLHSTRGQKAQRKTSLSQNENFISSEHIFLSKLYNKG